MFPTVLLREEGGLRVVPRFRDLHDRDITDTFVTNPRITGKPSFAGSWRNTILISHIQHKTIYIFQQ